MTLQRLSHNTLILLISNIGGALLLFALSALIGRTLGGGGLGVYAVVLAWVYPLSLLVEFGLTTLMTRDVGANPALLPAYMDAITRARLVIGGIVLVGLYAAAPLLSADPDVVIGLQVAAPMVILQPFYSQFTTAFKLRGDIRLIPLLNIGMIAAQVVLTALVLLNGGTILHALILNTVTSAGQLVAAWGLFKNLTPIPTFPRIRGKAQTYTPLSPLLEFGEGSGVGSKRNFLHNLVTRPYNSDLSLLRAALPFALAAVFAALQARLVFFFLDSRVIEAGYFSAANRFIEAAKLLPNAFFGALFPLIGSSSIRSSFQTTALGLGAFGVLAGIGFTLTAPLLLSLVFGDGFLPAAPTLIVLGWALLFMALRGGKTIYWYAHHREGFINRVNAAAVVALLLLSAWLIPASGAFGAAIAVLLTEIGVTLVIYAKRAR